MSQAAGRPSLVRIADELDVVGQRLRLFQIVRGAMLWLTAAIVATAAAALTANSAHEGRFASLISIAWIAWIAVSLAWWVGRPLFMRPRPLSVARLVEARVDGLHNGLSNSLLLSEADDLHESPWLGAIFDEVARASVARPLSGAVRFADLKRMAVACAGIVVLIAASVLIFPAPFAHGFRQLFSPAAFVPKSGEARIVDVQPGDVTIVAGQPLEIAATVEAKPDDTAQLIVAGPAPLRAAMALQSTGSPMRFAYRVEHVDESMRYRIEVGGTQSRWFDVHAVKQIALRQLQLRVTPPAYTKQPAQTIVLPAAGAPVNPVTVLQGSKIELDATMDAPVSGAMLKLGNASPMDAKLSEANQRVVADFNVLDEMPVSILLTAGTGQIVAALPTEPLVIHCINDAPPSIEMKWPTQDVSVAPDSEVKIAAILRDDLGLASARVLVANTPTTLPSSGAPADGEFAIASEFNYPDAPTTQPLSATLDLKPEQRGHGQSIRVQVQATDTRGISESLGPQTVSSPIYEIRFRDPTQIAKESAEQSDKLRAILMEMLKSQRSLYETTVGWKSSDAAGMKEIGAGQDDLRKSMRRTAETFDFAPADRVIQKTLQMLAINPASEAVDLAAAIANEPVEKEKLSLDSDLQSRQRRIISTLESLLAILANATEPTTQPTKSGGDLKNEADAIKKLDDALKQYMAQQQKLLDQTANLAKKPVDRFDDNDKKQLDDLAMAQEKLDAFMQERVADFSKLAEQDMSNSTLLKELMEVYSEVTMAKDALNQKAVQVATPAEENGLELAKELSSNLEKWLPDSPDRQQWKMEDPIDGKTDVPMAELPKELEDMVGELMEQQEDLFDEMEDANSNMADSMDKGAGWDAMDGPIANMSAKGVTGNTLPNNNEMNGRSGEGRSGKSQGEFVEDGATGKGGRNTPTRLDPTPFQQGQIKDTSKDPVGGATGGGKLSGQSGEGLEGPVPPQVTKEMQRLAQKQAQLRNSAERLNLQYQLGRYDNFKLLESTALMRRVEADLNANRYVNALRHRDLTLDALDTSHLLLGGEVHVQQDTTPTVPTRTQNEINDAMKGNLPPAWSEALKEYYRKLSQQ